MYVAIIRMRMKASDAHYAGDLVDGAHMLSLFGDAATELAIVGDGDEGLFRTYKNVDFLAPIRAGDFIEVRGWYTSYGETSRTIELEAWKIIAPSTKEGDAPSAADMLPEPILVGRATAVGVIPKKFQRKAYMALKDMVNS